jgi:transposase
MRLGGWAQEGQLFPGTISSPSWSLWSEKAACAVAASLLTTIYHMLKDGTQFQDLGADHFDRRSTEVRAKHLVGQLAKLGFEAKLTPFARAA